MLSIEYHHIAAVALTILFIVLLVRWYEKRRVIVSVIFAVALVVGFYTIVSAIVTLVLDVLPVVNSQ